MSSGAGTPSIASDRDEHDRLRRLYEGTYLEDRYRRLWAGPGWQVNHLRKWETLRSLVKELRLPRPGARLLDLGAGRGIDALEFERLGWDTTGMLGVDVLASELRLGRAGRPDLPAAVADATRLPLRDDSVDLVFQSTMLSSILDETRRSAVYAEAARVLKRGGAFLSYDVRYPNPWNRHTRPVRLAELRRAFAGWSLHARSVGLLPPLARWLAPISLPACRSLERLPVLRSHLVVGAVKP